uniref:Tripartite motif containing 10 n=1 Tax=Terrapene triunguis TaxID=2587831 RepID=A0A674IMX6_9SAUR
MAAAAKARQSLQDEASCSICLEYFNDPVTIDCGHNFCRACITQCWEGSDKDVSCPQCRATFPQRNLRPNWQLASVVEIAKQLNLQSTKDAGAGRACEKHQETLKLFCQEDQSPICVVCDRSKEHRAHTVVPAEEAAQEYKVGRNARPAQLSDIATPRCVSCSVRQAQIGGEGAVPTLNSFRKKILSEFEKLHLFLEEKELLLLAQLEVLDKEILKRHDEFTTRLTQEISRLGTLISEMEGKCRQPASEFLQVRLCERYPRALSRQVPVSLVKEFSQKHTFLEHTLSKFKGNKLWGSNVTLDPDTAHPHLILSEDGKSVRWGPARQDVPDNFRRFDPVPCVLGCEGFTSGRHCWEVEVDGSSWAVGVARESVTRKGGVSLEPEEGIWAVGQLNPIQYVALTSPWTSLPPDRRLRKIRVALDYKRGQVAFFNAENNTEIFTFIAVAFAGRIFPFCWVADKSSQVRMCH